MTGTFLPGSLPGIEGPDVVTIFARAGKGFAKLFSPPGPKATVKSSAQSDHSYSYGVVYANDLAAAEISKSTPKFPVGSVLVRERLDELTSIVPTTVIAMIKRDHGFSNKTGDWEFFLMNGTDMKLVSRETTGNCAACHTKAQSTDWVFVDTLSR